jgi:hypothetical protein
MKNLLTLLLIGGVLFLTSCETTREITINNDGTGKVVTTTDMSSLLGMAKMSGQGKELEELDDKAMDTVIALSSIADSLPDLTTEERALIKQGTLNFVMNMADEKFITKIEFPFTDPAQLSKLDKLTSKVVQQAMKKQMGGEGNEDEESPMPGPGDLPEGTVDDYFVMTYSKGVIEKKLNKEKHAKIEEDEGMKALQEMSAMGGGSNIVIYNLPRPAKKAEGKNVKLSEDKKKVTITTTTGDFFDEATDLEYKIEY